MAKNIVSAGLARRCEVQLACALLREHFYLRPGSTITDLTLCRPTAACGHFGHSDLDLPWEHTPHADGLGSSILGDRRPTPVA